MRFLVALALVSACGTTVTRARTDIAAKAVVTEAVQEKATVSSDTAKRVHRVRTVTKKPSGEVVDVTITDIGVDTKASSVATSEVAKSTATEASEKTDVTTKTRGWKWFVGVAAIGIALVLTAWFVGKRLVSIYL